MTVSELQQKCFLHKNTENLKITGGGATRKRGRWREGERGREGGRQKSRGRWKTEEGGKEAVREAGGVGERIC